jgi:hypothetical protein
MADYVSSPDAELNEVGCRKWDVGCQKHDPDHRRLTEPPLTSLREVKGKGVGRRLN